MPVGAAWVPVLGDGPWRTWYAECCDAVLAFERVSAALPAQLRAPVDGLADQLTPLLEAARRTSELGAYLDEYGPWPDPRPRTMLAEDPIADLSVRLPVECATTPLYDLLQHQRGRLEEVADELTRLAATARENPAATDVAGWLAALGTGVSEASRSGYTAGTLEPRPVPDSPDQDEDRPATPAPEQPAVEPGQFGWSVGSAEDRIAAGLPGVPGVTGELVDRYLAAEWAVLRYHRALASTPPESVAGSALADGWPVMVERLARIGRLADLAARAPWWLPAPRRRGPHRTRYPAGARHLHNLHRELATLVTSAEAAVRLAVAVALADWAEPSAPRPGADPATTVEQALGALATALSELAAATPTDH